MRIKEKSKQFFSFLSTTSFEPQNVRWILKSHTLMSSIKLFFPSKKVTLIGRESSFFQRKDLLWKSNRWESLTWRYSTFPNKNFKCLLNRNEVLSNKINKFESFTKTFSKFFKILNFDFLQKKCQMVSLMKFSVSVRKWILLGLSKHWTVQINFYWNAVP